MNGDETAWWKLGVREIFLLLGLVMLGIGLYLVKFSLALIVMGLILIALSIWGGMTKREG